MQHLLHDYTHDECMSSFRKRISIAYNNERNDHRSVLCSTQIQDCSELRKSTMITANHKRLRAVAMQPKIVKATILRHEVG